MARYASPMAFVLVAHAVTTGSVGPFALWRMDTCPAAMFAMIMGTRYGLTLRAPPSARRLTCASVVPMPPMPEPTYTPRRSGSMAPSASSPLDAMASSDATSANCTLRSLCSATDLPRAAAASKPFTSAATLTRKPVVSNAVMVPMPDSPLTSASQLCGAVLPTGVMAPMPVMTTLRSILLPLSGAHAPVYMQRPPSMRMTSPVT